LLHLIIWRGGEPIDCLRLDAIDFAFHFGGLFEYFRCEGRAGRLDVNRGGATNGDDKADDGTAHDD